MCISMQVQQKVQAACCNTALIIYSGFLDGRSEFKQGLSDNKSASAALQKLSRFFLHTITCVLDFYSRHY